jgi:hypothetical protein
MDTTGATHRVGAANSSLSICSRRPLVALVVAAVAGECVGSRVVLSCELVEEGSGVCECV